MGHDGGWVENGGGVDVRGDGMVFRLGRSTSGGHNLAISGGPYRQHEEGAILDRAGQLLLPIVKIGKMSGWINGHCHCDTNSQQYNNKATNLQMPNYHHRNIHHPRLHIPFHPSIPPTIKRCPTPPAPTTYPTGMNVSISIQAFTFLANLTIILSTQVY